MREVRPDQKTMHGTATTARIIPMVTISRETDTHYGPNGAYHPNGYFGPDGGWHNDKPGTNPHDQPNGGNNGDHGLIGGNGGVEHGPTAAGMVTTD